MQRAPLPFAFARDNQVALDASVVLIGPEATANGLREARRRAGAPLTPSPLSEGDFQAALARLYDDAGRKSDDPDVAFIGLTFARGLRSILRQDPDVILVGEIRDAETALVASEAALTGHLVFSSRHANNALSVVVRLRELGVNNYLISSTLRGVVVQRLVRRLCPLCRTSHPPTEAEARVFTDLGLAAPPLLAHPKGCADCEGTGFDGRIGVFDILEIDDTLREAIDTGAPEARMRALTRRKGSALFAAALARVATGETALDEVRRAIGESA